MCPSRMCCAPRRKDARHYARPGRDKIMGAGGSLSSHVLRSRNAYPTPNPARPTIVDAKGSFLRDIDGRTYFDAASGSGAMIFGHGDEEMAQTLASQALGLTVFPGRQLASSVVETYMERLDAPRFHRVRRGSRGSSPGDRSDPDNRCLRLAGNGPGRLCDTGGRPSRRGSERTSPQ